MPDRPRRSPVRLLAPLALVAFVVALLLVLGGSGSGGGDGAGSESGANTAAPTTGDTTTAPEPRPPRRRASYTVEGGDTLGAIAVETGVSVETIQELNPELDPQALVTGQEIKLRE